MRQSILFASSNAGKLREVKSVAAQFDRVMLGPSDLLENSEYHNSLHDIEASPPDPDEIADTYLGNAKIKADAFRAWCSLDVLADDTGLEVLALNGVPGIYSARYAGPDGNSQRNREKLLSELSESVDRGARFCCALYLARTEGEDLTVEATLDGQITRASRGNAGFGYDSVFEVAGTGRTLAELKEGGGSVETHRVRALYKLFQVLDSAG